MRVRPLTRICIQADLHILVEQYTACASAPAYQHAVDRLGVQERRRLARPGGRHIVALDLGDVVVPIPHRDDGAPLADLAPEPELI